ncbi:MULTISPECIES: SDR family NAD(P)-dependent oxidoreductase [Anaerolinea]|uniref:SDR family NAD(P)-dependent oxidoreductase n=1 Tax=Anaerolinea TaxID=233189 RepID=UPI00261F39B9|nr:SDR family oxidoreductase [Anaerolinea thermophila]
MELTGKTALITGGAVRVGKAITLALARAGANVVINYFSSQEEVVKTAHEAEALGVRALPLRADIADRAQVEQMVREVERQLGGVDVLVNSASPFLKTPFPVQNEADWERWKRVLDVLIYGAAYCASAVAPGMLARGQGAIVNILDLVIYEPWRDFTAHAVGKAGLLALTRQLALELAPAVRVNAVAPGAVLPPEYLSEERRTAIARRNLMGRWGNPEDVAGAVLFLARSDFITGEVLVVDGGERWNHLGKDSAV